jgi:hypothetical protein
MKSLLWWADLSYALSFLVLLEFNELTLRYCFIVAVKPGSGSGSDQDQIKSSEYSQ